MIGGRYTLRTAIGHGGMGTVWRATDTVLRRDVAVKEVVLPPGLAPVDRDSMYQRTLREARAAAALSHPAVVQVYDVVTDGGRPWIVMELLQARSLAEMIVEDGPLAPRAVAKIGIALLGALEVAHAAGVLHRDVKPANVLICSDGRCVLTDFGVARMPTDAELTSPGMVLGSPHFISPERAVGASFGPPSDLFSLGVTLYTAVEGRPPFDKPDPFETMRAVVEEPPAPAMRAGALAGVLYGLLEKDPARRWDVETSRSVLRDLLVGSLASNVTTHFTDPYAVVRQAPFTPPTAPTSGQVGGRAMLAPGESLSDAQRRLGGGRIAPSQRRPVPLDATSGGGSITSTDVMAGHPMPAPAGHGRRRAPEPGGWHAAPAGGGRTADRARQAATRAVGAARRLPRWAQAAAAGTAAVVVIGLITAVALTLGSDDKAPDATPQAKASAAPSAPPVAVQQHRDQRGFQVNVPKEWDRKPASSYVDYVDPADSSRRVRINVETTSASASAFARAAETRLINTPSSCAAPYARVAFREDATLAGQPAVVLEYTCGSGDQMRHAMWLFRVQSGKAYSFFLTVPDTRFGESRPIFDEMVRSFTFGA